jgi:hypothetical protein
MFSKRWTAGMVVRHIKRISFKMPLNSKAVCESHPDLHAAAQRVFGSWGDAVHAAGFDYSEVRRYRSWSKSEVIAEIRRLHERNADLASSHIQKTNRRLYHAAVRRFGSWENAIIGAGIEYARIRKSRKWTNGEIAAQVRMLIRKGEDMAYPNMHRRHGALLKLASDRLGGGSWPRARTRCGDTGNYRIPWQKRANLRTA